MSVASVFVIGNPSRLPPAVRQKLEPRQVHRLDRADVCVALTPPEGRWAEEEWTLLRKAHQDHHRRVVALWIDERGRSLKPPKPWPGSCWIRFHRQGRLCWYQLSKD